MNLRQVDLDREHPGVLASYIVEADESILVFDPGPASTIETLYSHLTPSPGRRIYVFVTHVHLDHAGGLGHLLELVRVERVFVHERGVKHLVDPERLWESSLSVLGEKAVAWGKPKPVDPAIIEGVRGGMTVKAGDLAVEVVNCEGHASHQVCYYLPNGTMFPGDALGEVYEGSILLLTPPPFIASEALASLDRIARLKPKRLAIPHFGVYDGDSRLCERYKAKLLTALCLASAHSGDAGELLELLRNDEEYRRGLALLSTRDQMLARGFLERSISGLIDYINKYGWHCPQLNM
ncbi:MBL fold metallo-hydrolase [Infirmifilum lucidum]|uniref:MBL fold metallo-hydrolase n=1 Tax=Infirmifilum lucidum TaxID=2776706 RepID=A0A7L9FIH9_9CREN|nr:MBL fold metallo-hydrolase [Infirmifilum lucidum]QOJ78575.1 MBL fold metallo-hydrolase [Infirmifilum lucidum]